jgi:manganese efflux pump family protein
VGSTVLDTHRALVVALLVPLALDTFVLAAALGLSGLPRRLRLRTSLVLAAFEGGMPLVGVAVGRALGAAIGDLAGYAAALAIALAGVLLLRSGDDANEEHARMRLLAQAHGAAIIGLGVSIRVDELSIGLSLGLLQLALPFAILFLGMQAFAAAQLGLLLGGRLHEELREGAERLAGGALIVLAVALIALQASGHHL